MRTEAGFICEAEIRNSAGSCHLSDPGSESARNSAGSCHFRRPERSRRISAKRFYLEGLVRAANLGFGLCGLGIQLKVMGEVGGVVHIGLCYPTRVVESIGAIWFPPTFVGGGLGWGTYTRRDCLVRRAFAGLVGIYLYLSEERSRER